MPTIKDQTLDARARRAAKRIGLAAIRSRRKPSIDNYGGFQIINPYFNAVVAGEKFNLSADQVVSYCREVERRSRQRA
jgi:hypothetical protein